VTHSLHRAGVESSFFHDYVVLIRPGNTGKMGITDKCREILCLFEKHKAVNISTGARGRTYKSNYAAEHDIAVILEAFKEGDSPHCVFDSLEKLRNFLADLKTLNYDLPVVVSGLREKVESACNELDAELISHIHSLGIRGNPELVPKGPVLEIITMCGHGLVSKYLVEHLVREVRLGRMSLDSASQELAKPCLCGIFNPQRAKSLLRRLLDEDGVEYTQGEVPGWVVKTAESAVPPRVDSI
jgi:hypothetical protein